jgi:hypothetical protein
LPPAAMLESIEGAGTIPDLTVRYFEAA